MPVRQDAAGNLWAELAGERPESVVIGGHLDCVPNGGWLDGCWNVMAGLEVLRYLKAKGKPPVTVKLVSWATRKAPVSDAAFSAPAHSPGISTSRTCAT